MKFNYTNGSVKESCKWRMDKINSILAKKIIYETKRINMKMIKEIGGRYSKVNVKFFLYLFQVLLTKLIEYEQNYTLIVRCRVIPQK